MRLPLWSLWQSNIYWNGDGLGSVTGFSSVQLPDSAGQAVIQEGKNVAFIHNASA